MGEKHKGVTYAAKVVEVIKDVNDIPTLELRVRVPTIHGSKERGVPDADLPLARPMVAPGAYIDRSALSNLDIDGARVFVMFDYGELSRPRYIALMDETTSDFELPYATEDKIGGFRFKKIGTTGYIFTSDD